MFVPFINEHCVPYTLFAVNYMYAILDKVIPQSDTYNNTKWQCYIGLCTEMFDKY